jgi:succinylglutamate desuccinylase
VGLTVMGAVHGNEVAGAVVVTSFVRDLLHGVHRPTVPVGIVLGNAEAVRAGRRYLERDLNRSFGRPGTELHEDARARSLEPLLSRTALMVDVHQTSDASRTPFFIFPYTSDNVRFARGIAGEWPCVTHAGDTYGSDGLCSDEFVVGQGGIAITLELGQSGRDPYQEAAGTWAVGRALAVSEQVLRGRWPASVDPAHLYTWAKLVQYPEARVSLRADLCNFSEVVAEEVIGTVDGKPLRAPASGWVLFPMRPAFFAHLGARPGLLYRLLRRTTEAELSA